MASIIAVATAANVRPKAIATLLSRANQRPRASYHSVRRRLDNPPPATIVAAQGRSEYVTNGKFYVFGGCLKGISGEGGTQNAWEYDPAADTWRALAQLPVKRCSAIAEEVGGKIYLIGGLEPLENGRGTRVTGLNQMYDPATDTWTNRSPMPTARSGGGWATYSGRIYVSGGELQNDRLHATFRALEAYEASTNRWVILPSMPAALHGNAVRLGRSS